MHVTCVHDMSLCCYITPGKYHYRPFCKFLSYFSVMSSASRVYIMTFTDTSFMCAMFISYFSCIHSCPKLVYIINLVYLCNQAIDLNCNDGNTGCGLVTAQIAKFTGPTWVLSAPDGPHVGPMNLAIRVASLELENHAITPVPVA